MSTYNQTNLTNFVIDIPDAGITQAFTLNIQQAAIPGMSIPVTNTALGNKGLGRANLPGSTFEFEPLVVRALVDENLQTWVDIYKWMISINNYISHDNEGWKPGYLPPFITLHVLNNDKTKPILSIHYYDAWPQMIGDLEFDSSVEGDPAMFALVTFQYKYFAIERDGVIISTRESITDQLTKGKDRDKHGALRPN